MPRPANIRIVYECTVGSNLHGLATPNSDIDLRYVTILPLRERLSPFQKDEVKVGSSEDTEAWELSHFVKHAVKGNGTIYEVLWSNLFEADEIGKKLKDLRPAFLDSKAVCAAHVGYANAQIDRYLSRPMRDPDCLKQPHFLKRVPKATVAAYRILLQARQLLTKGDFIPRVADYDKTWADHLRVIKSTDPESITADFCAEHLMEVDKFCKSINELYDKQYAKGNVYAPNYERIKDFLSWAYLRSGLDDVLRWLESEP